jgi:hypothetical protein
VKRNVQLVAIPEEWKEKFLAKIEIWETEGTAKKQVQINRFSAELAAVKSKIERVNTGFADGSLDLQEFKEIKNPLIPKKVELEAKIIVLEKTKSNRLELLRNWILEANYGEKLVSHENFGEMKSFLQKVGSNRFLRDQTLTISFIKPWDSLAETNMSVRSTADFSDAYAKWWRWRELNRALACETKSLGNADLVNG